MIIIFEGPDNAGKSTIAKIVAEQLGFNLRGRITRVGPAAVLEVNKEDLTREGNWVMDRCYWLSDMIYEPIYNGNNSVLMRTCTRYFDFEHTYLVHVTCSEATIRSRMAERGDELYNVEQILQAKRRYDQFFADHQHRLFQQVDTTNGTPEEHANIIIERIKSKLALEEI